MWRLLILLGGSSDKDAGGSRDDRLVDDPVDSPVSDSWLGRRPSLGAPVIESKASRLRAARRRLSLLLDRLLLR